MEIFPSRLTLEDDGADITDSDQMGFHSRSWRGTCDSMTYECCRCCKLHEGKDFFVLFPILSLVPNTVSAPQQEFYY